MRVLITQKGTETCLSKREFDQMEAILKWLRILARERPMIRHYGQAQHALENIQRMFGKQVKVLEVYRVTDEAFAEIGQAEGEQRDGAIKRAADNGSALRVADDRPVEGSEPVAADHGEGGQTAGQTA